MLKAPLLFGMDVKRRMEVSQDGGRWREAVSGIESEPRTTCRRLYSTSAR
jgi:hypothetical protein